MADACGACGCRNLTCLACHEAEVADNHDRLRALEARLAAALKVVAAADTLRREAPLSPAEDSLMRAYDAAREGLRKVTVKGQHEETDHLSR